MIPSRVLLGVLALAAAASLMLAVSVGSVALHWQSLWTGAGSEIDRTILWDIRLPRAAAAFAVGGLLALAGALMQVLLRNPLADPYVLGVSGGAATAALLAILIGASGLGITAAAFAGALISTALVFGLARGRGSWQPVRLLLTGVVVASGWAALIGFILTVSPAAGLRSMLFWLMGDLDFAGSPFSALAALLIGLAISLALARDLNVLSRGELPSRALGVDTARLSLAIYVIASLLTAAAVTLAGSVGFVGLVVPHLLRLLGITDHRLLLPGAVLLGGALVTCADTAARTVLAPQQLPVGILTALLGVPVFLYLLNREPR